MLAQEGLGSGVPPFLHRTLCRRGFRGVTQACGVLKKEDLIY